MYKVTGILLTVLIQTVSCRFGTGSCANPPTKSDFELSRFLGRWYGQFEYSAIFNAGVSCSQTLYTMKPNGHLRVLNKGYYRLVDKSIEVEGDAFTNPSDPATLIVSFNRFLPNATFRIVETDYDTYSVLYSCKKYGFLKHELAWVLTREPTGLPSREFNQLFTRINNVGINTENFDTINQNDCPLA